MISIGTEVKTLNEIHNINGHPPLPKGTVGKIGLFIRRQEEDGDEVTIYIFHPHDKSIKGIWAISDLSFATVKPGSNR